MIDDRQPRTPVPFSGGRKPTPRSVRIVNMQDSNAVSATAPTGAGMVTVVVLVPEAVGSRGQIGRRRRG